MLPVTRTIARVLALVLTVGTVHATTVVDIPTAKKLASTLIDQNQPRAAREILVALRARTPNDPVILTHLSQVERALGNPKEAIALGKSAFRNASTKQEKFTAARVTAQALSTNGQRTQAQLWLRRAGALAPTERHEAVIRSEYRYVRARNPLSFSFGGSVTPSDNVNDAPRTNRLVIGPFVGINPTAVPISGIETTVNVAATLRLPSTENAINSIGLTYFGKRVSLGSEAASIDPDLRNEDLSFDRWGLEWSGRYRSTKRDGIFDATASLYSDRFGGESFQIGQRIQAGYTWPVAANQTLRLGVDLTRLNRLDSNVRSSDNVTVGARWSFLLENSSQMSIRAAFSDIDSRAASVAHSAESIGVVFALGKPVATAFWAFAFDVRQADFDNSILEALDPRKDTQYIFSASATFSELDVLGFAPVVEFRHERNQSNISSFERRASQIGLSLRSTY